MHLTPKHPPDVVQEHLLAGRTEHTQRLLVDIDHANLLHAARDEFRVHRDEGLEVVNALRANAVEQAFHGTEILDPQRDRGVLEQIPCILFAAPKLAGTPHLGRDVFQRKQNAAPIRFIPWKDACANLNVKTPAIQRIVDRLVRKLQLPGPQRRQLMEDRIVHVIPEDLVQIRFKHLLVLGRKQLQRAAIDFQHLEGSAALPHPCGVLSKVGTKIGNPRSAPAIKKLLQGAVVLQPERHRRQFEHVFEVCLGR
ncbi:hypothetical protein D3C72_1560720 [compost metagenome]